MITIYHNPRCSKSREVLEIIKNSGQEHKIREYLVEHVSKKELEDLLAKLHMAPIELVRTEEKDWKENYQDRDLSDDELLELLVAQPRLIERTFVVSDDKAVLARPPVRVHELLR